MPELNDVVETCIGLHNKLPAHVEVSWDVLLTDDGPVYLEGNIFPPGCDYKLTIFKKWENFRYLKNRLLGLGRLGPGGHAVQSQPWRAGRSRRRARATR